MAEPRDVSDFAPIASWRNLRLRAELLDRLRSFFTARDFLEVETPLLAADVVKRGRSHPRRQRLRLPPVFRFAGFKKGHGNFSTRFLLGPQPWVYPHRNAAWRLLATTRRKVEQTSRGRAP